VLFDLLTALLDSWTVWNAAAGSEDKGRAWRAEYLRLTYGCGAYVPYEQLVKDAARTPAWPTTAPDALEAHWDTLPVWDGATRAAAGAEAALQAGRGHQLLEAARASRGRAARHRLGRGRHVGRGRLLQARPAPLPAAALDQLGVARPQDAAFVAGSGYDMFGTSAVGLRTYWHNRVGLALPQGAPSPELQGATLAPALPWLQSFGRLA
jgi:2-haloacid dehalogenase